MKNNTARLVLGAIAAVAAAVGLWLFFKNGDSVRGPVVTQTGCARPAELAQVDDRKLRLAATQLGKVTIGELSLERDQEVVQLLSENQKNQLVMNYLMCEAKARGEFNPDNAVQVERAQTLYIFMSTNPTAAEFIEMQKLLKGGIPTGRLEIPDLTEDGGKQVLFLTEPVQTISLLNAGRAEMSAWVRNDSPGRLIITPRSPARIQVHNHFDVEIGLLSAPTSGPWRLRFGSSATDRETEVEVRVAAGGALADLVAAVAAEIESVAGSAPAEAPVPATAGAAPGPQPAPGARWLADRAHGAIKKKYSNVSDEVLWAVSGAVLEQMNWNGPAVVAYRNSRTVLGAAADELDVPLGRAQLLGNVAADPARGEKPPADVLGGEHTDVARLASLKLASGNALVIARPELATRLSTVLLGKPALAAFAQGLKGDIALASNSPQAALQAYDACARESAALSCTLRMAEAQVKLQDLPAVNATLSQIAAQTPAAVQPVTTQITRGARRAAAAAVRE